MSSETKPEITIVEGTVADKIFANAGLISEHWDEVALNKSVMVLNPDVERYSALEDSGMLLSLLAYDGDKLIGYSVNIVTNHLHYSELRVCQNDVLFVHPDYRKSSVGARLIKATEEAARRDGCQMCLFHAKPNTVLERAMPVFGYGVQDVIYSKVL